MKRYLLILGLAAMPALTMPALSYAADQAAALELAKKSGCLACHSVDKKVVGPAWMDVSKKYKGAAKISVKLTDGSEVSDTPKNALVKKVKAGGKGNWTDVTGGVPMPPYSPRVADADIDTLVSFVLSLAE
jgi:cytochrome c